MVKYSRFICVNQRLNFLVIATPPLKNISGEEYYLRKKQLEVDEKRIDAIMVLKKSLDKTNTILQEKNDLLREYLASQTSRK